MTAGIFSTQTNVMPLIPQNFVSFVLMTLTFGVAGYIFLKYQERLVQLWRKLQMSLGRLPYGNVIRFWAVCTEALRLLLRHAGIYGARANAVWLEVVQFVRRHPPDASQPEEVVLEMALPSRRDQGPCRS